MCDCEQLRKQEIIPKNEMCCKFCHIQNQLIKIKLNEKQVVEICCDIALYLLDKEQQQFHPIMLFNDNEMKKNK